MSMGISAIVSLQGTSPYSCSRMHGAAKLPKESHDAYEKRTWREKAYFDAEGHVLIPRMAFKFALMSAASYLGERVVGKGQKTWTGYFTSAVHIEEDIVLPLKKEDLQPVTINAHVNGDRKSGKRVQRIFPLIPAWKGTLLVSVLDETITQEIFTRIFQHAGAFIGIGRFRPQNGGFNGRFQVGKISWEKAAEVA